MKVLIVVDMQRDFINGSLGTKEAQAIVPAVAERIASFEGKVFFTRDTHRKNYLETQEGRKLPVVHCVKGTPGWEIDPALPVPAGAETVDKPTFGSEKLARRLKALDREEKIEEIVMLGLCTDICVISNALLIKAFLPETPVAVDSGCCAGVTPESHRRALEAMRSCQIGIL